MRKLLAGIAMVSLSALPLAADVVSRGDDGWTTPDNGQTQVNLASFPVSAFLGAGPQNNIVPLKGLPLDSANLGSADTLINRPDDIVLANGTGSGRLRIVALSLQSINNVVLTDGRQFILRVYLSGVGTSSDGSITLTRANGDGGTFESSLPVLPKLVFIPAVGGSSVVIDCGTGACGEMIMSSSNSGWVNTGGPGGFDPVAKGVTPIRSGVVVDADGDGLKDDYTTQGKGTGNTFHAGFSASAGFQAVAIGERHEDLAWHQPLPPLDCADKVALPRDRQRDDTSVVANPTPRALCPAKTLPHEPVGN